VPAKRKIWGGGKKGKKGKKMKKKKEKKKKGAPREFVRKLRRTSVRHLSVYLMLACRN
jgi:hypothetical protein